MRVLIFADDMGISSVALHFGVGLTDPEEVQLTVLSTGSRSIAAEVPPPLAEPILLQQCFGLPRGIRVLAQAMRGLEEMGFLQRREEILIRETSHGYAFSAQTPGGAVVDFVEKYGRVDSLVNQYFKKDPKNLVVLAAPRRKGLEHVCVNETARRFVKELKTSVLVARGGSIQSRLLICADGSRSAHQLFPVLEELLSVVQTQVDLLWVQDPDANDDEVQSALDFMTWTRSWLDDRGKEGEVILSKSSRPVERILETAGSDSLIVMGACLNDTFPRNNLPLEVLSKTDSSVLLARSPLVPDAELV